MDDLPIEFIRTDRDGKTYVNFKDWVAQRTAWLQRGKNLFSAGVEKFNVDLEKADLTYRERILKRILDGIDDCLLVLSATDENSSNGHAHLVFDNIEQDIGKIVEETETFQNLGSFKGIKGSI